MMHKWSRKIHRWISIYVVFLTLIWIIETISLPHLFSDGLPIIDNTLPTEVISNSIPSLNLEKAIQVFLEQSPDGINFADEIDTIVYLRPLHIYRFENQINYYDWYINAQTGELLKYGFNAESFLAQQGFLKWLHPWLGSLIQSVSSLLMLILLISGFYLFLNPFLLKESRRNKS